MYVQQMRRAPRRLAAFIIGNSILLPIGALVALVWANVELQSYEAFASRIHFVVNDVGMTLFFALATKEIVEAATPGGSLHPVSKAITPVIAAAGGMVIPAILYLSLVKATGEQDLTRGWAIPAATDIAFSFLVARWLFTPRHAAVPFLLVLAIADDAMGLIVLAMFYPTAAVRPIDFAIILGIALAICWMLRRRRVTELWPYLGIGGSLAWVAFFRGGLHPALALVPIVPFLPHARHDAGLFEEPRRPGDDALSRFERSARVPAEVVLFLFGLANAGVPFTRVGTGTWIVAAALIVGKPLGICLAAIVGQLFGATTPTISRSELFVVGCVAGIGFTVALFFCTAAFPEGEALDQTKIGALLSFGAAAVATIAARVFGVGRFAQAGRMR
jgi:NhaA family Na+:H+ antiporter